MICGAVFTWYQGQISNQQERNRFLQAEITKLEAEIKDIASLQREIASLRARQIAVEDLQANRNLPVHMLDELVKQLPDGIYLRSVKQENQNVLLQGVAQSQERVSELLRNLANNSDWLTKPDLIEIVAATVSVSGREQRRLANFTIRATLTRPAPAAAPAVAPVPAAKG